MGAKRLQLTVLATLIAEAVAKDEAPEGGGCDISAGLFGPHLSQVLRDLVAQLPEPVTSEHHIAQREAQHLAATEAYFSARPELDLPLGRKTFEAGFVRGFDHPKGVA